jgi:hypothetical protein
MFALFGTVIGVVFAIGYALPWFRQTVTNTARNQTFPLAGHCSR